MAQHITSFYPPQRPKSAASNSSWGSTQTLVPHASLPGSFTSSPPPWSSSSTSMSTTSMLKPQAHLSSVLAASPPAPGLMNAARSASPYYPQPVQYHPHSQQHHQHHKQRSSASASDSISMSIPNGVPIPPNAPQLPPQIPPNAIPAPIPPHLPIPETNNTYLTRDNLPSILTHLSSRIQVHFGFHVRLVVHGGFVAVFHQSLKSRRSTRDIDFLMRAFVKEYGCVGPAGGGHRVPDAEARLLRCIEETARKFGLGKDWMNSHADVALPMAYEYVAFILFASSSFLTLPFLRLSSRHRLCTSPSPILPTHSPSGALYDPIHTSALSPSNTSTNTLFTSPSLTLISTTWPWSIALKLVRFQKDDPRDIAAMLKLGFWKAGIRWDEGRLEGWIRECCPEVGPALGFSDIGVGGNGRDRIYWPKNQWAMWQQESKKMEVRNNMVLALDMAYGGKDARAYAKHTEMVHGYSRQPQPPQQQQAPPQQQQSQQQLVVPPPPPPSMAMCYPPTQVKYGQPQAQLQPSRTRTRIW